MSAGLVPLADNSTDIELERALNSSFSGDLNYIIIGSAVAAAPIALVIIILITSGIIGLIRYAVRWRRGHRSSEGLDAEGDYNPYIFMEDSNVPKRPRSINSDAYYMEIQHEPQDYEVPRSSSQENGEMGMQHKQQNHSSGSSKQIPEYENNEVVCGPSQKMKVSRCVPESEDDYENQEVIDAQFQSTECLNSLSSSYVFPDSSPSAETQARTNCKRPLSQAPSYVNTPNSKSRPSNHQNYITIVN